jgi:hypothetical protein
MAMELARLILYVEFLLIALAVVATVARFITPHSYRVQIGRHFRHLLHSD